VKFKEGFRFPGNPVGRDEDQNCGYRSRMDIIGALRIKMADQAGVTQLRHLENQKASRKELVVGGGKYWGRFLDKSHNPVFEKTKQGRRQGQTIRTQDGPMKRDEKCHTVSRRFKPKNKGKGKAEKRDSQWVPQRRRSLRKGKKGLEREFF